MKKTLLPCLPQGVPCEIARWIGQAQVYDSSCSPEARVYFVNKDEGYYLKTSAKGSLKREAEMTAYFYTKRLGTEVLAYVSEESDWLLTARVRGEDCTHARYLSDPKRLCDTLAIELRGLHELDFTGCPVMNRMQDYFALVENNYRAGHCELSLFSGGFAYRSAEEAHAVIEDGKGAFRCDVLLHGDYCLPNIMLDDWRLSAFIDLGNGGVGDRHVDLFWGVWTLWFNLGTDRYHDRFLDAYGRDKADESMLRVVAAAEVFG